MSYAEMDIFMCYSVDVIGMSDEVFHDCGIWIWLESGWISRVMDGMGWKFEMKSNGMLGNWMDFGSLFLFGAWMWIFGEMSIVWENEDHEGVLMQIW